MWYNELKKQIVLEVVKIKMRFDDEYYIDIAIEISKKAKYPYGIIHRNIIDWLLKDE